MLKQWLNHFRMSCQSEIDGVLDAPEDEGVVLNYPYDVVALRKQVPVIGHRHFHHLRVPIGAYHYPMPIAEVADTVSQPAERVEVAVLVARCCFAEGVLLVDEVVVKEDCLVAKKGSDDRYAVLAEVATHD